ncbi:MAG: hypothetical protein LBI41_03305 [Lactobacillales bacterium]|jgi:hypothetical protein|nr:hypothetical protein [Lactobacillales bacterium]
MKHQEIVPLNIREEKLKSIPSGTRSSAQLAARLKIGPIDISIYNGCDKYIIYTVLKEVENNAG